MKFIKQKNIKLPRVRRLNYLSLALVLVAVNFFALSQHVFAGTLSNSYIRISRMAAGVGSAAPDDVRVAFKTTATAGATGFTINFNGADTTTWTGSSGAVATSGMTVTAVAGCDVSSTAAGGSPTASGSGSTLTVSSVTALSANTEYCWDITKASTGVVTTPTAGEYHPVITETGGATDSTTVALRVVSNDQITVNATVTPSFNFAISGCASNTDSFTTALSSSAVVSTTGCTITVNTNAKNGWFAWAKDANTGLTSASASHTIACRVCK